MGNAGVCNPRRANKKASLTARKVKGWLSLRKLQRRLLTERLLILPCGVSLMGCKGGKCRFLGIRLFAV